MINSSEETEKVLKQAVEFARKYGHDYVTTEHLFLALLYDEKIAKAITKVYGESINVAVKQTDLVLNTKMNDIKGNSPTPSRTHGMERVFQRAFTQGVFQGNTSLETIDLLVALQEEKNSWTYQLITALNWNIKKIAEAYFGTTSESEADELLTEFCDNITKRASEGKIDPVIGRELEVIEMAETLARKTKNNVLLLGDAGVGKTAVVENLALKINKKEVPEFLYDHTIWSVDITSMLAGTRYRGEFEERLKKILSVLKERPKTILFIDEAHMIMGAGSNGKDSIDMGNMLKPMLSRGEIKVIAATTWEDFRKSFEKDRAIQRRFNKVIVDEPSVKDAKKILSGLKTSYEKFHNVKYSADALNAAVDLSVRFINNRKLPDKAIDVIDMAGAQNKTKPAEERVDKITRDIIVNIVSKLANVPVTAINSEQKPEENVDLDVKIKKQVYGQDLAVDRVLDSVYVARAGLRTGSRPLANFLFLGPTGCGKTELAKQLGNVLGMKLIRFDMGEYQEKHAISKLIGAPPGYVGFEDSTMGGGLLINEVEKNPNSIILLDEIEKAHPDLMSVLLPAMDDGRLTGSNGKTADLTNCIIILTSNLGARDMERFSIGFNPVERTDDDDAVKNYFAPEFRNRLDAVIKFDKLSKESIKMIASKFVNQLRDRLREKKITIKFDPTAWDYMVANGYDERMGARPMNRLIEREISLPLSREILFGSLTKGGSVQVKAVDNKLVFSYNQTETEAEKVLTDA